MKAVLVTHPPEPHHVSIYSLVSDMLLSVQREAPHALRSLLVADATRVPQDLMPPEVQLAPTFFTYQPHRFFPGGDASVMALHAWLVQEHRVFVDLTPLLPAEVTKRLAAEGKSWAPEPFRPGMQLIHPAPAHAAVPAVTSRPSASASASLDERVAQRMLDARRDGVVIAVEAIVEEERAKDALQAEHRGEGVADTSDGGESGMLDGLDAALKRRKDRLLVRMGQGKRGDSAPQPHKLPDTRLDARRAVHGELETKSSSLQPIADDRWAEEKDDDDDDEEDVSAMSLAEQISRRGYVSVSTNANGGDTDDD